MNAAKKHSPNAISAMDLSPAEQLLLNLIGKNRENVADAIPANAPLDWEALLTVGTAYEPSVVRNFSACGGR